VKGYPLSKKGFPPPKGAILIVSLILLLVMSLLGIGAMDTSILALKLSTNYQQNIVAFNILERDLRIAVTAIESHTADDQPINFDLANDGYYDSRDARVAVDDWAQLKKSGGVERRGERSEYIVEYLGWQQQAGSSLGNHTKGIAGEPPIHNFVLTIRTQIEGGPVSRARSLYTTKNAP